MSDKHKKHFLKVEPGNEVEVVLEMTRRLTGQEPTAEDREEVEKMLKESKRA